jgi:opacity protein-like surface antigen
MKKQRIAIVIASLFTASLAQAQYFNGPPGPPPSVSDGSPWPAGVGPYFRADIGPTFFQNSELKGYSYASDPSVGVVGYSGPSGKVSYDVGVSGDAAFGWAFNRYVALGFETGYVWGRMDSVENYVANGSTMGNVPFLANLTLSLAIPHSNIVPYIGGGIGGADSIFDAHTFFPISAPSSINTLYGSQNDVVFAWQASAGVRFQISPGLYLGVGYQYFATGNPTFSYPPYPNLDAEFQGVRTHTILFTLQASF